MKASPYGLNGHQAPPRGSRRIEPASRTPRRWQDGVTLLLGLWLFATPWVWQWSALDLSAPPPSSWVAWVVGGLMVVLALWALMRPALSAPEYLLAILGLGLFLAPWVPDGARVVALPTWNQWAVGAVTFVLALWAA